MTTMMRAMARGLAMMALFGAGLVADAHGADAEGGDPNFAEEYEDMDDAPASDPLRGWNVAMYHVNDRFYFWLLKPVSHGYAKVLPEPGRKSVRNFFTNVTMPVRFVNCALQGKGRAAGEELRAFAVNTTVGVLGFRDAAGHYYGYKPQDEDLGQTFGHHGLGSGWYVVWPFLGPSSVRDTVGMFGDGFLNPLNYLEWPWRIGFKATDIVNGTSLRIGQYEALKEAAFDPYDALRDAYGQRRAAQVRD